MKQIPKYLILLTQAIRLPPLCKERTGLQETDVFLWLFGRVRSRCFLKEADLPYSQFRRSLKTFLFG